MKKLVLLSLVCVVLLSVMVSAQFYNLEYASEQIIDWIQAIFGPFFAAFVGGAGEFLFERILFLFIVLAVTFSVLSRVPFFQDRTGAVWVITAAVSILATRFLTETQLIQNILLPYSVLGVALTAFIPLVIFFYFVEGFDNSIMRKVLWVGFLVVFLGLWMARYNDLGTYSWIYFFTGVVALIFFLADGTIRRALVAQQQKQLGLSSRGELERELRRKIQQVQKDINNNIVTPTQGARLIRTLKAKLAAVHKA